MNGKIANDRAHAISQDPELLRKRIDLVNQLGVVHERLNIAAVCSVIDSRLILPNGSGQETISAKISGKQGTGKSLIVETALKIFHPTLFHEISSGSDKSFFYINTSLKHKALILSEGFKLEKKNDSGFCYVIRSLLSEGRATHQVTKKIAGQFMAVGRTVEGPVALITTTTVDRLEKQIESRLLTVYTDESSTQTSAIILQNARNSSSSVSCIEEDTIKAWQAFHKSLEPAQVVIPYAEEIAKKVITSKMLPTETRRSFKSFISLIKAIAIAYQQKRERDPKNRIIAEVADYQLARQIAAGLFEETLHDHSEKTLERLDFLKNSNQPTDLNSLSKQWGVSKKAVSKYLKPILKDGFVMWCDKSGKAFLTEDALDIAKHSGTAFVKSTSKSYRGQALVLPSAYDLTGDAEWKKDGWLWNLYDLRLNL